MKKIAFFIFFILFGVQTWCMEELNINNINTEEFEQKENNDSNEKNNNKKEPNVVGGAMEELQSRESHKKKMRRYFLSAICCSCVIPFTLLAYYSIVSLADHLNEKYGNNTNDITSVLVP